MPRLLLLLFLLLPPLLAAFPPNIVLIFVDDLGYGDLSCYGGEAVTTPNVDRLAAEGMRFTDAYVTSAVCGPSRTGLLSGAYPQRFGVYWNPDTTRATIPDTYAILPEILRSAGYRTGVIGKWNITRDVYQSADYVRDPMIWGGNYWPEPDGTYPGVGGGWGDNKQQGIWGPRSPGEEYLTDRLTQHAVNFIAEHGDAPFFLYLAYNAPHSPLQAQRAFAAEVAHLESEPLRLYYAMVLAMDAGVGRVLEALEQAGVADNTLVVFMSDNGPAKGGFKGYRDEWPQEVLGSTGGLRGQKGGHYEGGIRVPLLMRLPGQIPAGSNCAEPVISLDFMPTFAALAGTELHNPLQDGRNLVPLLRGEDTGKTPRPLYWANEHERAIRLGDWKLYYTDSTRPELYNLSTDPAETDDLAALQPAGVTALRTLHDAWMAELPPPTDHSKPPIITPAKERPLAPVLP